MSERQTYLLLSDFERLEDWCRQIRILFGVTPYLVGSALTRPDFRDVDVRVMLQADQLLILFGNSYQRIRIANHVISTWGQRETGLPIDFQIQATTEANAHFPGRRDPMGIRDWAAIAPSGLPRFSPASAGETAGEPPETGPSTRAEG